MAEAKKQVYKVLPAMCQETSACQSRTASSLLPECASHPLEQALLDHPRQVVQANWTMACLQSCMQPNLAFGVRQALFGACIQHQQ